MPYLFPFGEELHPLIQQDRTPKKVFVLGVYASAVHARWVRNGKTVCPALAVASEPRIFWDGNGKEAEEIIGRVRIPEEAGILTPAGRQLNGPSAKVLDEDILLPLGFTRKDAWLCDLLPETRLNPGQVKVLREKYEPVRRELGLNEVTVPKRPNEFCSEKRAEEITGELTESEADLLVLLGDIPIAQYLKKVADIPFDSLGTYTDLYGYGTVTEVTVGGRKLKLLPLAHPRQIGALGAHSEKWNRLHKAWEDSRKTE